MIERISTVSLFVSDQDRAKAFYTDILGFELRTDAPLYPGSEARWIAVAPIGAETELILYLPDENWSHYEGVVGKSQSMTFEVSNMDKTYEELKGKGVKFIQEPDVQSWGTFAIIEDSEGNHLIVNQQPES